MALADDLYASMMKDDSGIVPDKDKYLTRYPFVMVVDVSFSTGQGPDPDIRHINTAINKILATLRQPPPGTDLANNIDQIDFALITYSHATDIALSWSTIQNLPPSVQEFRPLTSTATALALTTAINYIQARLRYYKENKIPTGMPNIIHLTDGAPTDMTVGDPTWTHIANHLNKLHGTERRTAAIIHYVAPNGCKTDPNNPIKDETGALISGQETMSRLSGKSTVYSLGTDVDGFTGMVEMLTVAMGTATIGDWGIDEAAKQAKDQGAGSINIDKKK